LEVSRGREQDRWPRWNRPVRESSVRRSDEEVRNSPSRVGLDKAGGQRKGGYN
jgi:hypothetical protein